MSGYIGSKTSVTQVDGYNRTEADAEFVQDPNGAITVSGSNVGIGTSSPRSSDNITSLEISGNTYARHILKATNSGGREYALLSGTSGEFWVYDYTAGAIRFRIDATGAVTMPAQPAFAATRSQGHVGDSTYYICPNVYYNKGNHYNASTGTFTAPVAGIYAIATNFMTSTTVVETNQFYEIRINDGYFQMVYDSGTTAAHYRFSWAGNVSLAANDTVRVYTGNVNLYGGDNKYSYFSAALLG